MARTEEKEILHTIRDMGISLNSTLNITEMQRIILEALSSVESVSAVCLHIFNSDLSQIAFESGKGFSYDDLSHIRETVFAEESLHTIKNGRTFQGGAKYLTPSDLYLHIIPCVFLQKILGAIIIGATSDKLSVAQLYACELTAARTSSLLRHLSIEDELKQINREMEKANKELRISEERYRAVVEDQVDFICRYSPSFEITFANSSFCRFFGIESAKIRGTSLLSLIHHEDRAVFSSHIHSLSSNHPETVSCRACSADGSARWMEWTNRAIPSETSVITEYQSVGRDITERRLLEDRLRYMSMHDSLTGLYNRAYFDEQMKRYSDARFIPTGIIVIDLNALKIVNDAIGHQQGDNLLISTSNVLMSCFRSSDTIARIGGDEFSILLPNTDEKTCQEIIARVRHTVQSHREQNPDTPLSLAIGYSIRTKKSSRMEEIFSEADDMMYREKENQRDFARGLVLTSLIREIERVDPYRGFHMIRVQNYCMSFADELGLPQWDRGRLSLASRYHDIGMIGVEKNVILNNAAFSQEDYEAIQSHTEIGARIADAHPFLKDVSDLILYHHERWDGSGYLSRMKGEKIPLLSRIIAICDSFDAMLSHTSYRKAFSTEKALEEIEKQSGVLFDPSLTPRFSSLVKKGSIFIKADGGIKL